MYIYIYIYIYVGLTIDDTMDQRALGGESEKPGRQGSSYDWH